MLLKIHVPRTGLNDEIVLTGFPVTIGSAPDNTVTLDDTRVSRHHAKIELTSRKLILTDLGSANGVYLDDQLIQPRTPVAIERKDRITVGEFQFWFEPGGNQALSTPSHWTVSLLPTPGLVLTMGKQVFRYPFNQPVILIGRTPDSAIIIDHPMVSRRHAEIRLESSRYILYDVGSTNGFIYEGERITQHALKDGDQFTVPGTEIRFEFREFIGHLTADRPLRKEIVRFRPTAAAALGLLNLKGMDVITIGRADTNRIVLSHPQVELYHAAVERSDSRYLVKDLNSLGGVFVNEKRVNKETWLHINDEIRVAGFRFALHESGLERLADEELRVEAVLLMEPSRSHRIEELSMRFGPNELVGVVGASDTVRTALLEALSAVHPPSSGQLLVNGIDLYHSNDRYRRDIGYVPRKNIVHSELNVFAALDFAAQLRMLPNTSHLERQQQIREILQDLDLIEQRSRQISKLAGDQVLRVNLGVALLTQPRLLFLDGPTAGLDPAGSADVMRLLRKQADQGRSVLLTAPATQQIMMCDKVAILTPGGRLAFFGPPEEALGYFDAFREAGERQSKPLDYSQIQDIFANQKYGSDQDWQQRYLQSQPYQKYVAGQIQPAESQKAAPLPGAQKNEPLPAGFWHQFSVLTRRNLSVILHDKIFLGLILALGPLIGLLNIFWGSDLFDLRTGSPDRIIAAMFMAALLSVLVGIGISIREIVREVNIYTHERMVGLYLFPYIFSKLAVGALISLYQSLMLTFFLYLFVLKGSQMAPADYALFFVSIFLGIMSGYLIGLVISAAVTSQKWAYPLVIAVLLLQFIFSGVLIPLNRIPAGNLISLSNTTRWEFEALVNISGVGRSLVSDACWQRVMTSVEKSASLTQAQKEELNCACLGINIFTQCQFPGILSAQNYPLAAQQVLAAQIPLAPVQPPAVPTFTPVTAPARLPTFTLVPIPTLITAPLVAITPNPLQTVPAPTSEPGILLTYTAQRLEQERIIQATRTAQQQEYENQLAAQETSLQDLLNGQKVEYDKLSLDLLRLYDGDLLRYTQALENWQTGRENAVAAVENRLQVVVDYYGSSFQGNVLTRWLGLGTIMLALFVLLVLVLRLKDPR